MLAKEFAAWRIVAAAPPREVFATMEQLIGFPPYRYEVVSDEEARILEHRRRGFFGQWSRPRLRIRWVTCRAVAVEQGTSVEVRASSGGGLVYKALGRADRGPVSRGIQLVKLLAAGRDDARTIYRARHILPGPVTLVASWAGTAYALYTAPRYSADRGARIYTATELEALPGGDGAFVRVRVIRDGVEGYVERDQIVVAPAISTREAQLEAARHP
jgi:hypothetical protein